MKEQWYFSVWNYKKLKWDVYINPTQYSHGEIELFNTLAEIDDYISNAIEFGAIIKIEKAYIQIS